VKQNNLLNFRYEALNQEKFEAEVKHSLRLQSQSSTNNQVNDNPNILIDMKSDNLEYTEYTNKANHNFLSDLKKEYEEEQKYHRKLWNRNREKGIIKKGFPRFGKSFGSFIFSFSDKINEDLKSGNLENILKAGKEAAKQFSEDFKCDILYLTLHLDEKGNPHFQGMATNYNRETGAFLNIQTNKKNGEKCQDILAEHFEPLGYERGKSKTITGSRHLTTEEYKELQELRKFKSEFETEMENIYKELLELSAEPEAEKFLKLFTRYSKSEAKPKLENLIKKYQKSIIKKQKSQAKIVSESNKKYVDSVETTTKKTKTKRVSSGK